MQKIYKELAYKKVISRTNAFCIKNKKIGLRSYDPISDREYITYRDFDGFTYNQKMDMITHMLSMYNIKWKIINHTHISIPCSHYDIKLHYSSYCYDGKLNKFPLYEMDGQIMKRRLLLLVSNPLKFINVMRKYIDESDDENIKEFFILLEKNIINKLNASFDIYLALKAMVYENMIIRDIIIMVANICIQVIRVFG